MRNFSSFGALADHFAKTAMLLKAEREEIFSVEAKRVEGEAKAMFGVYQEGWEQLEEDTQKARERAGYTPNDPLRASGDLQGKTASKVTATGFKVGNTDERMEWMEMGTVHIPPRPVFSLLAMREGKRVAMNIARTTFTLINGGRI